MILCLERSPTALYGIPARRYLNAAANYTTGVCGSFIVSSRDLKCDSGENGTKGLCFGMYTHQISSKLYHGVLQVIFGLCKMSIVLPTFSDIKALCQRN